MANETAKRRFSATPDAREKILLVDDDSMAGNTVREILEHFGYEVDFWVNPVEALNRFQQQPYGSQGHQRNDWKSAAELL